MFKLAQKKKEEQEKKELAEKPGYAKQMSIRSKLLTQGKVSLSIYPYPLVSVNIQRWPNFNRNYPVCVIKILFSVTGIRRNLFY